MIPSCDYDTIYYTLVQIWNTLIEEDVVVMKLDFCIKRQAASNSTCATHMGGDQREW